MKNHKYLKRKKKVLYITIFKHSWVIYNFYSLAYITCLRFLDSLSLLFTVLCLRKIAWYSSARSRSAPDFSLNAQIDKTFLIPVCEIQIHFVCFLLIRMSISSFTLRLFLKFKWMNHSDIEWKSINRKKKTGGPIKLIKINFKEDIKERKPPLVELSMVKMKQLNCNGYSNCLQCNPSGKTVHS